MDICDRFIKYVKVDTTSNPMCTESPSFEGEWNLANMLADDLREIGLENVHVSEHCYVTASLPATDGFENCPKLGFIAHMDTVDAAPGKNVNPIIWHCYDGGDLKLSDEIVLSDRQFPFLKSLVGQTLITSDGTTLLGADDKAGIAEIFSMLEELNALNIPHGPIKIGFTPDEEIGSGTDYFELDRFDADFAYTVDGGDAGELEYQNFNAAQAELEFHGLSVHPGSAKNIMVNAQNIAIEFHALLPESERPEHTEGEEGFFHLCNMVGDVTKAELTYIIRDHSREKFEIRKDEMKRAAEFIESKHGAGTVKLTLKDSYYNMEEKILPHMHLIDNAKAAIEEAGATPIIFPVRGGTDGALLSYKGLPCPNLGTGGFNAHGVYELASLEKMKICRDILINIVRIYSQQRNTGKA
ncbi:MAG: peptidase T [Oscillospiraceae bacterium]